MIPGTEGLTEAQIVEDVGKGGRFVYYTYCFSVVVMTFRRSSAIVFVRSDQSRVTKGLGWSLLTLACGWWGIPWGPIFSIQCLWGNFRGGQDVTDRFVRQPG